MELETKYNLGLPTRFQLQNGKFLLVGGTPKVDDNVSMLLAFVGWYRLYTQDYVIDAYRFYQNTTNYLFKYKNIIRLKILDIGVRYVPFAKFTAVDIPIDFTDRKSTSIQINFSYKLRNVQQQRTIKRVII